MKTITLNGCEYPNITKATLMICLPTGRHWLDLTEGAGNFHYQHHSIEDEFGYLQTLLTECAKAGIPTETVSID